MMKGSWFTTLAAAGIILVLTGFLALQYNWLRQASDAEQEKMQRRLESDVQGFADELNREFQRTYYTFQTESSVWENGDWSVFNERYATWQAATQYPDLVKQFVFYKNGSNEPIAYFPEADGFRPLESVDPAISELYQKTLADTSNKRFYESPAAFVLKVPRSTKIGDRILVRSINTVLASDPADLLRADNYGTLLVIIDKAVITEKILPELTAKHFPEQNFRVGVTDLEQQPVYSSSGNLTAADAEAGLLSLMPNNFMFFDRITSVAGAPKQPAAIRGEGKIESHTISRTQIYRDNNNSAKVDIKVTPQFRIANGTAVATALTSDDRTLPSSIVATANPAQNDLWKLSVQHISGSVGTFIQSELNRKLMIGSGLYLLAALAIIAIVYSAWRSKRFAQRQIDFVSSVSHEFRTPLAVVYSAGENLADGLAKDPEQVAKYGELIKGEGKRLTGMVEQILEFAGARSGKRQYNFANTNVGDAAHEGLNDCMSILNEQGFAVETEIDRSLPLIKADRSALGGAVQNLLTNAAKYSNGTRWVKLSVFGAESKINIVVEDRGIGIEKADSRRIFEPFFRSKGVVDAQIRGNGLGLSLVKDVALAHGGSVRAERNAHQGSKFTITLPMSN